MPQVVRSEPGGTSLRWQSTQGGPTDRRQTRTLFAVGDPIRSAALKARGVRRSVPNVDSFYSVIDPAEALLDRNELDAPAA